MSSYWNPDDYTLEHGILDIMGGCESVTIADDCIIKDRGGTVSVFIPAGNDKGHDSYDAIYDSEGNLVGFDPHGTN